MTSIDLKVALLQYFRFKRQYVCVDEFLGADIIADTGKEIIEVEIKVSKSDLINGEMKKYRKHDGYRTGYSYMLLKPNKFMFCVPETLVDDALKWGAELNEKYGVIGFDTDRIDELRCIDPAQWYWSYLRIAKSAKKLHNNYSDKVRWAIAKRASAKLAKLTEGIVDRKIERARAAVRHEQDRNYTR